MEDLRKVEVQAGDDWNVLRLKELKEGDVFRMTEPDEIIPFGNWVAKSDAREAENDEGKLIWMVDADLMEI